MPPEALNLLVFRADRRPAEGWRLKAELSQRLLALQNASSPGAVEAALLRAGEFECAVADADQELARPHSALTDLLAERLVNPLAPVDIAILMTCMGHCPAPKQLFVSPPEGFAYYALHPLAYAGVFDSDVVLNIVSSYGPQIAVVGIRS